MISERTRNIECAIQMILPMYGFTNIDFETKCKSKKNSSGTGRVDVSADYANHSVGIEIKQSKSDMLSGYGLNFDDFEYNILAVPEDMAAYAVAMFEELNEVYKDIDKIGIFSFDINDMTNPIITVLRKSKRIHGEQYPANTFRTCMNVPTLMKRKPNQNKSRMDYITKEYYYHLSEEWKSLNEMEI